MGRTTDAQSWRRIEHRVAMHSALDAEEFDRMAIFLQPPRIRFDGTSYLCTPLQLDQHEMTTMNAINRATCCPGLRDTSLQDELLSACVAELSAPDMSATGMEIVEKVIRNTGPLRGRVGTNLAGVLVCVIGVAFVCEVSSDAVARPDEGPSMAKYVVERSPDLVVAYTSSSNHHVFSGCFSGLARDNGPVTVALGYEPGCSSLEVTGALNSYLESDADIASQKSFVSFRE
eukprot:5348944-Pyramimonas_sp.AAC.1